MHKSRSFVNENGSYCGREPSHLDTGTLRDVSPNSPPGCGSAPTCRLGDAFALTSPPRAFSDPADGSYCEWLP